MRYNWMQPMATRSGKMQSTELEQINAYQTFRLPEKGEPLTDYQCIPYHIVFDVKFDLRQKGRLVAGGHWTTPDDDKMMWAWSLWKASASFSSSPSSKAVSYTHLTLPTTLRV